MIVGRRRRADLSMLAVLVRMAHRHNVPVAYVNALCSPDPDGYVDKEYLDGIRPIFREVRYFWTRDELSLQYVKKLGLHESPKYVPDALFSSTATFDEQTGKRALEECIGRRIPSGKRVLLFAGSSGDRLTTRAGQQVVARKVAELKKSGWWVVLFSPCTGDRFLERVAVELALPYVAPDIPIVQAQALLSSRFPVILGRYHPAIMAAMGGSPFITFGSNSHKTKSLLRITHGTDEGAFFEDVADVPVKWPLPPDSGTSIQRRARQAGEVVREEYARLFEEFPARR